MINFFDKIPKGIFSPLSRRSKAIYIYALLSLYHILKTQKKDIKKSDFYAYLKNNSSEDLLELFSVESDILEDRDDDEKVDLGKDNDSLLDESGINKKLNYIIRKLSQCGWYRLAKDPKTGVEYIYVPDYSIELMKLFTDLTYNAKSYLPLVHQTYAELKMVDDTEDDYIYRALLNARKNAERLEDNVILLKQQISVFGNRLTEVFDPNVALTQHFDEYRDDIADKYYHPMKTFDSLGLYAQPTIKILKKWLDSKRIIDLLVKNAKNEPENRKTDIKTLTIDILKMIQDIIDIFSSLNAAFNEIDQANSDYTEAVRRKVNYLSSSDKTIKGKIDRIILSLRSELYNNPSLDYEELPLLSKTRESVNIGRHGFVDSASLTMPIKRGSEEFGEPMFLDDGILDADREASLTTFLERDVNRFSNESIKNLFDETSKEESSVDTTNFKFDTIEDIVLYIFGVNAALTNKIPYKAEKISNRIETKNWYMPLYKFEKIKKKGDK